MKKILLIAVMLFAVCTYASAPENPTATEAREMYETISTLLENDLITIEEAQKMWLKYKKK